MVSHSVTQSGGNQCRQTSSCVAVGNNQVSVRPSIEQTTESFQSKAKQVRHTQQVDENNLYIFIRPKCTKSYYYVKSGLFT